jgi:hypothetical protein
MNLWAFIKGILIQDETDRSKELSLEVDPSATANTRTTLKSVQTANRELTLPDNDSELADVDSVQTFENKTMDFSTSGNNTLTADAVDILFDNTTSGLTATDVQAAVDEVENRLDTVETDLLNHLNDTVDAHDASAISNTPAGTIVSTDVQSAINELDDNVVDVANDITDHVNEITAAHTASAIANVPSGNLIATDVQAALNELQSEIDIILTGGEVNTASNLGTGAEVFKQKVGVDLQFRSIVAGSNITVTENADEIEISAGSSGANEQLSNLSGTVAFNLDLLPGTDNTRTVGSNANRLGNVISSILTAADNLGSGSVRLTNNGGNLFSEFTGNVTAPDGSTGNAVIRDATALTGSIGFVTNNNNTADASATKNILIETGNKTAGTGKSGNIEFLTGTSLANRSGDVNIETGESSGAFNSGDILLRTGENSGTLGSGKVTITTGFVANSFGDSGDVVISTGANSVGASGYIQLATGFSGNDNKGPVIVSASKLQLAETPLVDDVSIFAAYGVTPTNQLPHNGYGIIILQTTGAITVNGIQAGTQGQHLIIYNENSNNITFANQSASAVAEDRIVTCTGANATSTGASCHKFVYLSNRWVRVADQP